MVQENQLPWEAQSDTSTDERTEKDRDHDTERGEEGHSKYDWERPSERSGYDSDSELFGDEDGGELFGNEDGGESFGGQES